MKFAIGTVQFGLPYGIANQGGQVGFEEAKAILDYAGAHGINTLDTAMAYGESEPRLGEIGVAQWQVMSKLPPVPDDCADVRAWVKESVQESLRQLRINRLHGLLLHRPEQLFSVHGRTLYNELEKLKADGIVQKTGISVYGVEELDSLCTEYNFDFVQAPFNILDRRLSESGWLKRLNQQGIEVHARSIFLQGLLLMQTELRPRKFNRWQSLWICWHRWLQNNGLTALEACVGFALQQTGIQRVIIGVDSQQQLKEILAAGRVVVPGLPAGLACEDIDLLNPSLWSKF
jgi:aryl-alcohol dehydrogenase-like predicted oxidoreductase